MSGVYDNWSRLVEAVLKREELRQLAYCESLSSSISDDFSSRISLDSSHEDTAAGGDLEVYLGQFKRFSQRELQVATDNFSNKNILRRGEFVEVCMGRLANGSLVAVKRLKEGLPAIVLQFRREVELIRMFLPQNFLRFHGFCMTPTERLLVYSLMPDGRVMSGVLDYWNSFVEGFLKQEVPLRFALCESHSSSISVGDSSTGAIAEANTTAVGNSPIGAFAGRGAARAARLFAAPAVAFARYRRRKRQDHFFDAPAEDDPKVYLGQLKRFSLRELQVATVNFSETNLLGKGAFGMVYKGRLADGSLVAVRRLKEKPTQNEELQFQTEVGMISMALHRNLLRLWGFCITRTERLLVYPLMVNGTVASWLREQPKLQPPLDWPIRKRIALGSARGLAYLHDHYDPKIIHRDVKAANILLDEDFEAVVGDFKLAKLMDYKDTHVTTAIRGTIGHKAPEYLSTGKCSEKTDVFGYGVMLLELITGQSAYNLARLANDDDIMFLDWVKGLLKEKKLETLIDADLQGNSIEEEVEQLIQVALLCTQNSPMERPKMSEVVRMLEGDGLAKWWKEWQEEEIFWQDFNHTQHS